jgi:hypothetical protein
MAAPHTAPGNNLIPAAAAVRAVLVTAGEAGEDRVAVGKCSVILPVTWLGDPVSTARGTFVLAPAGVCADKPLALGTGRLLPTASAEDATWGGPEADVITDTWHCVLTMTLQ